MAMVLHFAKVIRRGDTIRTTTLCGRMNARNADGLNSTTERHQVTCKFCRRLLEKEAQA